MPPPLPSVVVCVPARDEESEITGCVEHLLRAADRAVTTRRARAVRLVVVAHRCTDRTPERAAAALAAQRYGQVLVDRTSPTLGEARDHGVSVGTSHPDADPRHTWVFSTDADSRVPVDWVTGALDVADRSGAPLVLGTTSLRPSDLPPDVLTAYERVVASRTRRDTHDHVYGANLAIRLDVYRAVGGFPAAEYDEDVRLVRACRELGLPVATPVDWSVATSARTVGRARHGLATTLHRLGEQEPA